MEQELIDLYRDYDSGLINRREFLAKMAVIAGSTAAASSLLTLLENDYALASADTWQNHLAVTGLAAVITGTQLFVFVLLLHGAVAATTRPRPQAHVEG